MLKKTFVKFSFYNIKIEILNEKNKKKPKREKKILFIIYNFAANNYLNILLE